MPALPTVTKTIRASLNFNLDPGLSGCRFYISYTGGPPSASDLNGFAGTIVTSWATHFSAAMSNNYALESVSCQDLDTTSGNFGQNTTVEGGTHVSPSLGAATCTVIDFVIARHYRGGKPKIFLPIGTQADVGNQQTWTGTFVSAQNANWGNFITDILAAHPGSFTPNNHVSVSYYSGYNTSTPPWRGPGFKYPPKLRTGPIAPDLVTTHLTRQRMGTQRRRLSAAA